MSVINQDWLIDLAVATHVEMAHIGRDKLCDLLSKQVFCPGLTKVVADIVYCCKRCQLYKTTAQTKTPPMHKIQCHEPFELVAADVVLFPRTSRGFIGCLVIVDHYSKWSMAIPIRRKTSAAVATAFEHHVLVALLRKPKRVLTDNGPEFRGPEFEKVLDSWGINHVYSTPLRPEGNGAVERCNRSLGQALRLLSDSAGNWDEHLARALVTYNTTRHAELKESPAEFLLRHQHADASSPIVSSETQNSWKPGHPEFAPFQVGELVKKEVHHPGNLLVNKFERRYEGPLIVTRVNNNGVTYLVKMKNEDDGQERRVHHSQLRPWKKPPAYLMRSCRRMHDLVGVISGPSQQNTATTDSAVRRSETSKSPRSDYHSSGGTQEAVDEEASVQRIPPPLFSRPSLARSLQPRADAATNTSPSLNSQAGSLHSTADTATSMSPVVTRASGQQTSPGLRGCMKVRFDVPSLRRSQRVRRPPVRFKDYVMD